jgi:hypothetical protein
MCVPKNVQALMLKKPQGRLPKCENAGAILILSFSIIGRSADARFQRGAIEVEVIPHTIGLLPDIWYDYTV